MVALAGNPNVGKSTIFNGLTGLNQHTGNWPGKTVSNARGYYRFHDQDYHLIDIPGTYSLMANSAEEEIARNAICFGNPDCVIVVADATCLERNLNLVLQTMEITDRVVLCVNLLDEAKKKEIQIDLPRLSMKLGIPVVGTSARSGKGLHQLMETVASLTNSELAAQPFEVVYENPIEDAIAILKEALSDSIPDGKRKRWTALKLLEEDKDLLNAIEEYAGNHLLEQEDVKSALGKAKDLLEEYGIDANQMRDRIVTSIVKTCEGISREVVTSKKKEYRERDRKIDRILTSKQTGIPIMILLLMGIFWLTIAGANYPSQLLASGLFAFEEVLSNLLQQMEAPAWLQGVLVDGVYRTVAWVVSVMLPPMAIFFPLFTLLEDLGYLPRIAFTLDNSFRKACTHGKQALTMCMGFGCNAAGVIGCRIIDSPRERLIATITNNFVPCNGRFPTLIALITMFFVGTDGGNFRSVSSALFLTGVILLGTGMTLLVSKVLSISVLKGMPSAFHLELPPFRRPQVGHVILRSIRDRTLFVLGRALLIAAPAGLIIWTLANTYVGDQSLIAHIAGFLDPFARQLGLDGYILLAFLLGFPANEIVVPIIIMSYLATGSLTELDSLSQLHALFVQQGWTWVTALCTILFSLMHWPCGTTCLTIYKETRSVKWTLASIVIPTAIGMVFCFLIAKAFG